MIYRIQYIKDVIGANYLGINIYNDTVIPYLSKLKLLLNVEYEEYVKYQQERDLGHYHITVIDIGEYNKLIKEIGIGKLTSSLESVLDYEIDDVKIMGIGTAIKSGNRAYFLVVLSEKLNAIRQKYNLPDKDLHITIGFKYKDVFGVRKNEVLPEYDPFIDFIKKNYYEDNESFDFIKRIDNYEGSEDDLIEPVAIDDKIITFKFGKFDYFSVSLLDDGKLRIVAKWQDNINKPILSNTLISKKLNKQL